MLLLIVDRIFLIFTIMIFIRILSSWLPELKEYRLMQFVAFYTDPYLNLFRKIIPPLGMIDLSPVAAYFCLIYLLEPFTKFIVYTLFYR